MSRLFETQKGATRDVESAAARKADELQRVVEKKV